MNSKQLKLLIPAAALLLGLAACNDTQGVTAREPATTSPMASPATAAPTNPVQGTLPGTNSTGAAPMAPGGSGGTGG
jgi:hypothetical protein